MLVGYLNNDQATNIFFAVVHFGDTENGIERKQSILKSIRELSTLVLEIDTPLSLESFESNTPEEPLEDIEKPVAAFQFEEFSRRQPFDGFASFLWKRRARAIILFLVTF